MVGGVRNEDTIVLITKINVSDDVRTGRGEGSRGRNRGGGVEKKMKYRIKGRKVSDRERKRGLMGKTRNRKGK